jgi:hypothetical protein
MEAQKQVSGGKTQIGYLEQQLNEVSPHPHTPETGLHTPRPQAGWDHARPRGEWLTWGWLTDRQARATMEKYLRDYEALYTKTQSLTEDLEEQVNRNVFLAKERVELDKEMKLKYAENARLLSEVRGCRGKIFFLMRVRGN